MELKAQKGDIVIFTPTLLAATLDTNGNTPFDTDDVGKMFTVNCAYEDNGKEVVHLQRGRKVTRSIPLEIITG